VKITPVSHGLNLLATDLVRSPGLHASSIFNALYAHLEPKRYGGETPPEPLLLALGTAWEKHLEYLLMKNGVQAERPDELLSPEGIAYSPDLLVFNGVTRLGEIKLTFQSSRDYPLSGTEYNGLPPKADKWICQMLLYAYWLDLLDGWLCVLFLGDRPLTEHSLRVFELTWTQRERDENYALCMNFARSEGLI
jgi:hypothetical protein